MNLKKTVLSLFAATAIVGSMMAPVYAEGEGGNNTLKEVTASTNEVGTTQNAYMQREMVFSTVDVSTDDGGKVRTSNTVHIVDSQADSSGWTVQIQASNLQGTNGGHIEASQFSVFKRTSTGLETVCSAKSNPDMVTNPSNDFYDTAFLIPSNQFVPLDTAVPIMKGDAEQGKTRGCGDTRGNPGFELTILPGQQVDSYSGNITTTTVWGEPDDPSGS